MQQRPYDHAKGEAQSAATGMKNLPKMQAEARKTHGEMNEVVAEQKAETESHADRAWLEGEVATGQ
ncbi:hypothetical protein [Croceicoccus sp. BE223]|uniref:hypothetical protein n=1 Tax=Croceicoccus sp. BE223 TaxID=2817716 RepID=UPI0028552BBA|nr:hypothetical protein [Croceicoccus sp. BE223]MDR7102573.1 hypothetical protein [Croceicoccus sp. BE223]